MSKRRWNIGEIHTFEWPNCPHPFQTLGSTIVPTKGTIVRDLDDGRWEYLVQETVPRHTSWVYRG